MMTVRESPRTTMLRSRHDLVFPCWVGSFYNTSVYHKPLLSKHHILPQDLSAYIGLHLMNGKSYKMLTASNLSLVIHFTHLSIVFLLFFSSSVRPGHFHPVHQGAQVPGCFARPQRHAALWGGQPGQHHVQVVQRQQAPGGRREALPGGKQPEVHRRGPAAGRRELRVPRGKQVHRRGARFHQGHF